MGRNSPKHALHAQVLVDIRPVHSLTIPDDFVEIAFPALKNSAIVSMDVALSV